MGCLRDLGLVGHKHIPAAYLCGNFSQRFALLRGLMDSDGHICTEGRCEYTPHTPALLHGIYDLLMSLGLEAMIYRREPRQYPIAGRPVQS